MDWIREAIWTREEMVIVYWIEGSTPGAMQNRVSYREIAAHNTAHVGQDLIENPPILILFVLIYLDFFEYGQIYF